MPSVELFVRNLPWETTVEDVKDLFQRYGDVWWVRIPRDRQTGKTRGFGFVSMGSPEAAEQAIAQLNGYVFQGRTLSVKISEKRNLES